MREFNGVKPTGVMKVMEANCLQCSFVQPRSSSDGAAIERYRMDPKDGDLHLNRLKLREISVEDRRGSDVQIDLQS